MRSQRRTLAVPPGACHWPALCQCIELGHFPLLTAAGPFSSALVCAVCRLAHYVVLSVQQRNFGQNHQIFTGLQLCWIISDQARLPGVRRYEHKYGVTGRGGCGPACHVWELPYRSEFTGVCIINRLELPPFKQSTGLRPPRRCTAAHIAAKNYGASPWAPGLRQKGLGRRG